MFTYRRRYLGVKRNCPTLDFGACGMPDPEVAVSCCGNGVFLAACGVYSKIASATAAK